MSKGYWIHASHEHSRMGVRLCDDARMGVEMLGPTVGPGKWAEVTCPDCDRMIAALNPPPAYKNNLVTKEQALAGVLRQYYEGVITYAEFICWILREIPAPCNNPEQDKIYRCLYAGALTAQDLSLAEFKK